MAAIDDQLRLNFAIQAQKDGTNRTSSSALSGSLAAEATCIGNYGSKQKRILD